MSKNANTIQGISSTIQTNTMREFCTNSETKSVILLPSVHWSLNDLCATQRQKSLTLFKETTACAYEQSTHFYIYQLAYYVMKAPPHNL